MKLAADGAAAPYKSPEMAALPGWAHWKDTVYATTFEPIAIVYNKRLVPAEDVPKTHDDLLKLLTSKGEKYQNKVTAYDPEKSGVGFMLMNQDAKLYPKFWELVKALGERSLKVQSSTGTMLERVSSGENLIGYNVLGSYALTRAKKAQLLAVLDHPEVPLHNNPAELGARRRVRKRDVSFGPRSEDGKRAWDTFQTLAATAQKLGVSFYAYIHDRVSRAYQMPSLADLIRAQAQDLNLAASWTPI